jgi:L-alanine-DL-glutamate epimerase-like enolase superfamily enzyme
MGFRIIKVKLGASFGEDRRRLASIRKAIGAEPILRVDANQAWDRVAALAALIAFEEFGVEFCEQPCRAHDLQGMRHVSGRAPIPVMADESLFSPQDALEIIRQDAAPYFNVKLSKSGGILNAQKIAHVAEAGYRPCMMGCMSESRLGITAAAHFALANPIVRFFDLDAFLEHAENPILGGAEIKHGILTVPDTPGIGARPDPTWMRRVEEVR